MKKIFTLLLLTLHLGGHLMAQHENDQWMFGQYAGLDFSAGTPAPVLHDMVTQSSCASAASPFTGELLFYTNGVSVWNRDHALMPNGTGLLGDDLQSASMGALIVPFVNDTNRFYVFCAREEQAGDGLKLHYSVVDMSLAGGYGDVVATEKNIGLADDQCASSIAAVTGSDCNIWLVTHMGDTNVFRLYEITELGLDTTPVVSTTGAFYGEYAYTTGTIKASPDGQTIGVSNFTIATGIAHEIYSCIELYDFDPATGVVSNSRIIDQTIEFFQNFLSFDFSPDGSKLYATNPFMPLLGAGPSVSQYDLSLPALVDIQASKVGVGGPILASDIRWGPDGKVYVLSGFGVPATSLDVIELPNEPGVGCQYNIDAALLPADAFGTTFLPSRVTYPHRDTVELTVDTFLCENQVLTFDVPDGYLFYTWQGTTLTDPQVQLSQPGSYTLTYANHCTYVTQTIVVAAITFPDVLQDTALCGFAFEHILDAGSASPLETEFLWQDGSTQPIYVATQPGSYWVERSLHGCRQTDAAIITGIPLPTVELGEDTMICADMPLLLEAPSADAYLWQDGSTQQYYSVQLPGVYTLTVTNDGCAAMDEILVQTKDCYCHFFAPNAFTPNQDGLNDRFEPVLDCGPREFGYELSIYNRWGKRIFYSRDVRTGWDGRHNGQAVDAGTYFYRVVFSLNTGGTEVRDGDVLLIR